MYRIVVLQVTHYAEIEFPEMYCLQACMRDHECQKRRRGRIVRTALSVEVVVAILVMASKKYTAAEEKALALELQKQLAKNTELVRVLYTLRGEAPPNNNSDDHSVMGEPHEEERPRSWEVYSAMPGIDSLHTGLSKRTPNGMHTALL